MGNIFEEIRKGEAGGEYGGREERLRFEIETVRNEVDADHDEYDAVLARLDELSAGERDKDVNLHAAFDTAHRKLMSATDKYLSLLDGLRRARMKTGGKEGGEE